MNVSVDVWGFAPVHSSDVRQILRDMRNPGNEVQKLGKLVVDAMQNI